MRSLTAAQRQRRLRQAATKLEEASNLLIPLTVERASAEARHLYSLRQAWLSQAQGLNQMVAATNDETTACEEAGE